MAEMKHIPAILISLSILLLSASSTQACSCDGKERSFVQIAKERNLVIKGKVLEYHRYKYDRYGSGYIETDKEEEGRPNTMTFEVQEVYKGRTKLKKVLLVGVGMASCSPSVRYFPIGTEWVFSLSNDSPNEEIFGMSWCAAHWLPVKDDRVTGHLIDGRYGAKPQVISLPNLRKRLKALR
jgi:hypothetical protein